jgi:D-tyrosyl-tRNA(Tyr) deacylase
MRVVIQRVLSADVVAEGVPTATIGRGLLVLLGIEEGDGEEDIYWLSRKIVQLRVFDDESGVMNLDVRQVGGEILLVSQFTLHASTRKGNRPSYARAAAPDRAVPLYERFVRSLSDALGKPVGTGVFGADMQVALVNEGPVTLIIDSRIRE